MNYEILFNSEYLKLIKRVTPVLRASSQDSNYGELDEE